MDSSHAQPSTFRRLSQSASKQLVLVYYRILSGEIGRHALGIICMLSVVVLWTVSNFLTSSIFADNTFSKPALVTYLNEGIFIVLLPIFYLKEFIKRSLGRQSMFDRRDPLTEVYKSNRTSLENEADPFIAPSAVLAVSDDVSNDLPVLPRNTLIVPSEPFTIRQTFKLALPFAFLWFIANYFISVCLIYTTVASSTILMSTSSVFTLILGLLVKVEVFSWRKIAGVLLSLLGVILISQVDISGSTDKGRGSFPHKTTSELALGDAFALASAVLYGIYSILLKKKAGDESRLDMVLFFGFVGLYCTFCFWPILLILHFTGPEPFELPDSKSVWTIIAVNAVISVASDFLWALAMLLTSPVIVTVGLSLTIPLALVGQMIVNVQTSPFLYWLGALIVLASFFLINYGASEENGVVLATQVASTPLDEESIPDGQR